MRSCRIITAGRGCGKTSRLLAMGMTQGFASIHIDDGYMLLNLSDGAMRLLMSSSLATDCAIGRWHYDQSVFDWANDELMSCTSGTVAIDEVGRLELAGRGFAPALRCLVSRDVDLVIAVRRDFADDVIRSFSLFPSVLEES